MTFNSAFFKGKSFEDWLSVAWHGLPLDFSMSGYLTIIPGILLLLTVWTAAGWVRIAMKWYFFAVCLISAIIFVSDIALYGYWGFRLDTTPMFYLVTSPKDAFASVSIFIMIAGIFSIALTTAILYGIFHYLIIRRSYRLPYLRVPISLLLAALVALLFIPIRGGFTVSTMNTGKAFFSTDIRLNHAAINPAFNFLESLSKQKNFAKQYRFMDDDEANKLFGKMVDTQTFMNADSVNNDSVKCNHDILSSDRPDVLIIIIESFSSYLMSSLGGEKDVAVNLDSLTNESVLFTHFYANSFRTDRGLVSVLSGYPAQPTTSLMKYPRKTEQLPSIARSLVKTGYSASYYYGGDADFTNMRSYLMSQGFEKIISDVDFPVDERLSKWGVHDHVLFSRLLDELRNEAEMYSSDISHHCRVLQTSSSHEPFDVPYKRLSNKVLNAFAYTDKCVGDFISEFKKLPQWQNTVVLLVPDHLGAFPENISNFVPQRYSIPFMLLGGAVVKPMLVETIGSQQDIAATLLAQMHIDHSDFLFSKDILDVNAPHFAFFTVPDAFGIVTDSNIVIHDNQSDKVVFQEGVNVNDALEKGKAYLQKLYDDIAER